MLRISPEIPNSSLLKMAPQNKLMVSFMKIGKTFILILACALYFSALPLADAQVLGDACSNNLRTKRSATASEGIIMCSGGVWGGTTQRQKVSTIYPDTDTSTCNADLDGVKAVSYTTGIVSVCDGTSWVSLSSLAVSGGAGSGSTIEATLPSSIGTGTAWSGNIPGNYNVLDTGLSFTIGGTPTDADRWKIISFSENVSEAQVGYIHLTKSGTDIWAIYGLSFQEGIDLYIDMQTGHIWAWANQTANPAVTWGWKTITPISNNFEAETNNSSPLIYDTRAISADTEFTTDSSATNAAWTLDPGTYSISIGAARAGPVAILDTSAQTAPRPPFDQRVIFTQF